MLIDRTALCAVHACREARLLLILRSDTLYLNCEVVQASIYLLWLVLKSTRSTLYSSIECLTEFDTLCNSSWVSFWTMLI
jgi:hypothetical protein